MGSPLLDDPVDNLQPCTCVGIRHCGLCKNPAVRQRFGLHDIPRVFQEAGNFAFGRLVLEPGPIEVPEHSYLVEIISAPMESVYIPGQRVTLREIGFESIRYFENFVSEQEELELVGILDSLPEFWEPSQSGRQKRNFGPAINYNKKKVSVKESYKGVPGELLAGSSPVLRRLMNLDLDGTRFVPAGWFFQEYSSDRGSNFDPHIDHIWIWGDRILDLNLLSESTLSFFSPGFFEQGSQCTDEIGVQSSTRWRIDVPLPRRSLLVFQGDARNVCQHAVLESNVGSRRVSLTVRELSSLYKETDMGARIEMLAMTPEG